ncbi:hypothetical protein [Sphingomonas sp.]|uniref:hypothetical protein n=1 Tax=Sphingomonas sp. TaxID=28214 RepID=UPI001AFF7714|nr:hypothetical protein [Sphingomonas sp.]MBO9714594.1 hypothetical protein [Sphingomonas sp.]
MKHPILKSLLLLGVLAPSIAWTTPVAPADEPFPEAMFEVFRLAPGRQEAFLRKLAAWDVVSQAGGQPATQLFVHEDGEGWDVLLFKPYPRMPVTPAQQATMDRKAEELHLKTGPAFWLEVRQNVAEHSETRAQGPITAAQWLARLDAWRAAHPDADKAP